MYSTMPSPLLVVCTSVFVVICLAVGWAMLRAAIDSLKSSTSDSPPPRCSHCHLTLSNASARYCPRCGTDRQSAGVPKIGDVVPGKGAVTSIRIKPITKEASEVEVGYADSGTLDTGIVAKDFPLAWETTRVF